MDKTAMYKLMRKTYDELIEFVLSENFKKIVEELYSLPSQDRPEFVRSVLCDPLELLKRGIEVPKGVLMQRSSFGDGRPTLFVVKKYLPEGARELWENVNITFDQPNSSNDIKRDESAWRRPLPFQVTAALQALGITAEELR